MRADRLLSIVAQLSVESRLTARTLAKRLEVSPRTIYRDIDALCMAGVPIVSEPGSAGGFSLPNRHRPPFGWLTPDDMDVLFVPHVGKAWGDLGLASPGDTAWMKLFGGLEGRQQDHVRRLRDQLLIDLSHWFSSVDADPLVQRLRSSIATCTVVQIGYERHPGHSRTYLVSPYALVCKAGDWYLVAADGDRWKVFRISRISQVSPTGSTFVRDPQFELHKFWARFAGEFEASLPRYEVTVRVAPELVPALPGLLGEPIRKTLRTAPVDPATGWRTLALTFDSPESAVSNVLSLGPNAEAVTPIALRRLVMARLAAMAARYEPNHGEVIAEATPTA